MRIRIIHLQPFGIRGRVEVLIGRQQNSGAEARCAVQTIDFDRRGELHSIVSP